MMLVLSMLAALIWSVLLLARGGFWLCRDRDADWPVQMPAGTSWPGVAVIVPARDEAEVIAQSLGALFQQDYPGLLHVILVDDDSKDGTAVLAAGIAAKFADQAGRQPQLTVLRNQSLPMGWTGKLWAMANGFAAVNAAPEPARFVLFCDADIELAPDCLRMLVATAATERRVMVSLMAKLSVRTAAERALVPAFVYFFAKLYPFAWVSDAKSPVAAAAGGCMLVNRETLVKAGGLERIRSDIIDDCALGRLMKRQGAIRLGLTDRAVSLRAYETFGSIRRMVARSAYAELKYSPLRLGLAVIGLGLTYLIPPLAMFLADGTARLVGLVTTLALMTSFVPILRFYRLPLVHALALPLVAAVYCGFTVESALLHWRGQGGEWKGRYQALSGADRSS